MIMMIAVSESLKSCVVPQQCWWVCVEKGEKERATRQQLAAFFQEHRRPLLTVAHRYSRRSASPAEDLLQAAFLRLLRTVDAQPIELRFDLVCKAIERAGIDEFRSRQGRRGERPTVFSLDTMMDLWEEGRLRRCPEPASLPNAVHSGYDRLWGAIDRLPEMSKAMLFLRALENYSESEIAEHFQISVEGARSQLQLIYRRLRQELTQKANPKEYCYFRSMLGVTLAKWNPTVSAISLEAHLQQHGTITSEEKERYLTQRVLQSAVSAQRCVRDTFCLGLFYDAGISDISEILCINKNSAMAYSSKAKKYFGQALQRAIADYECLKSN